MQHDQDEPHALGQEAADDAKVWRQYVEEATEHDAHMLNEWSRNVDVSLIFAGLFSAVVATFAAQSYETLSANPQDATNALLASILAGQTAMNSGLPLNDVEARLPSFTPSTSAVWINALWFTSLVCSLGVASVGMLVKQWLDAYSANLPSSPRLRARVRQYRYDILRAWYTHHIINCLPFALSLCLILFLSGLVILLYDNYRPIGLASLVLFLFTVGFHGFSILLPALTNCPWKTALSPLFYHYLAPLRLLPSGLRPIIRLASTLEDHLYLPLGIIHGILSILQFPWRIVLSVVGSSLEARVDAAFSKAFRALTNVGHKISLGVRSSVLSLGRTMFSMWSNSKSEAADEEHVITNMKDHLESCAILWMVSASTKRGVVDCALQSMAGLPVTFCDGGMLHGEYIRALLHRRLADCIHGRTVIRPNSAELYVRSLYRNRLSHETFNEVRLKTLDFDLLHNVPVDPASPLYITFICAKAMLNEILDCLANLQAKTATYEPYHIQLMVTSIAHEVSGRKGPNDDHWTGSASGGWAHISSQALPILIKLLRIVPADEAPSAVDISIAKCIVVLTNGIIDPGEASSNNFLEYVLRGLAAIIPFPGSYGCDTAEDISIIYHKYLIAVRRFPGSSAGHGLVKILRVFTRQPPGSWDLQDIEGVVAILARSHASALRAIDCHLIVYILQNITTLTIPPTTLIYQILVCAERLVLECACAGAPGSALLVDSLAKLIYLSIRNSCLFSPIQSQAFRVLINMGHQYCLRRTSLQNIPFIKEGLLDASREFFDNPSSIIQADVDLWVATLVMLEGVDNVALIESRAVDAFLQWTIRNWRGHVTAAPHMERLRQLAESLGIKIDLSHDPTWFRELVQRQSGLSKPMVARR